MSADTQAAETAVKNDHDSPWKEALERFFPEFLALLFPAIHAEIDWSKGVQFLDKEFQQIVREAKTTRRYADKLVGVTRRDGTPVWVLIHVEVQGDPEAVFAGRMFTYHYKIRDVYQVPVASLAVLAEIQGQYTEQPNERSQPHAAAHRLDSRHERRSPDGGYWRTQREPDEHDQNF